ncbi:glycoside hydrolase family 5 protein [Gelatoporia subvermispora B]|uniref:mannan endo-1,4-beta-mannosidase n=1 Tax=Ceriporiopsis subvermispora (strain B) TaxID=914234 RepID=M2RRE6_CERS8|nr:glycoside hydrolase family 5 protein [Gelatoporia subvermispora B]
MRSSSSLLAGASLLLVFGVVHCVIAANSFAGSNLYYAAGLTENEQSVLLENLSSAGMKVLRVWLDGQSTDQKGTPINPFPSLEPTQICNGTASCYNDTVLERLDAFMVASQAHGIKLLISMHSWNALDAGDVYEQVFGTTDFYTDPDARSAFDARLVHVLNHVHVGIGKPWKELKDHIFGFEAENEAMIGLGQSFIEDHQEWQCGRARTIRGQLGNNSGIAVMTGGESFLTESVQPGFLNCTALDVVSIHAYGVGDLLTSAIQPFVEQAQAAGIKLLFEEWGACFYDTENNDCPVGDALPTEVRNQNIRDFAGNITASGIPWLYWQVIPNADPHEGNDYEIGVTDPSWPTLKYAAQQTLQAPAAFDFSDYFSAPQH